MKKQLIYVGMLLLTVGFSACNEDYTDWADPQSNSQADPAAEIKAVFEAGKDADIVVDNHDLAVDSVEIVKLASTSAEKGGTITFKSLTINENYSLPYRETEGAFKVALAQLDSLTQEVYKSRASVSRDLTLKVKAAVTTSEGEGVLLAGNDVTIKLKPGATPELDPDGYFLVGDFTGWKYEESAVMQQDSENPTLYSVEVETEQENNHFKIFPASAANDVGQDPVWDKALGCAVDGDPSTDNFIVWKDVQAAKIEKKGRIKISIDMTNFRYTIAKVITEEPAELYMTGSAYGWGATWKPLVSVGGAEMTCWGIFYFAEGDQVKFAPQADWGGDFGFKEANISQESIELAGLSDEGGNVKVGKAGWYLVYVSSVDDVKVIEFEQPVVYLTGPCSGGWDTFEDTNKFTIPADANGEFVSPAFVSAGDQIRMCVRPKNVDSWWKAEFIVYNGKIVYRGKGGDPEKVPGEVGQKVYLNFTNGTGRVE